MVRTLTACALAVIGLSLGCGSDEMPGDGTGTPATDTATASPTEESTNTATPSPSGPTLTPGRTTTLAPTPAPSPTATPAPPPTREPTATPTTTPAPPPEGFTYTVQPGDTLSAVADRFGVTVQAIVEANGIADPDSIFVGQELVIPGIDEPPETVTPTPDEVIIQNPTLLAPVDKGHQLPASYVPPNVQQVEAELTVPGFVPQSLRGEALGALREMLSDASAQGYDIRVRSGYRSYAEQEATFEYWVATLGYEEALQVSAMPGHSEHQLGGTVDLTTSEVGWGLVQEFGDTAAGQWLENNAHEYGFALSYPEGQSDVTGYSYEPWHFRYITPEVAADWQASGLALNKYLIDRWY